MSYKRNKRYSSKNSFGNKTYLSMVISIYKFCSSKNLYGNKTYWKCNFYNIVFCSSKNLYGNKTWRVQEDELN